MSISFSFQMDQPEQLRGLYPYMDNMFYVKDGTDAPGNRMLGQEKKRLGETGLQGNE